MSGPTASSTYALATCALTLWSLAACLLATLVVWSSTGYAQTSETSVRADIGEALGAFTNGDYERVFDFAAPLADIGLAEAQHLLARVHLKREFAGYDVHEAFRLMRLSATQGLAIAQHDLGEMYRHGIGVERDPLSAFSWHLRAAQQRLRLSELSISQMYASGEGVERDQAQADKWAARAKRKNQQAAAAQQTATPPSADGNVSASPANKPLSSPTKSTQRPGRHPTATGYKVQFGAYQRAAIAQTALKRITAALPQSSLERLDLSIVSTDKNDGKGALHRIQGGPMTDIATARFICAQVKKQLPEQGCFIIALQEKPQ